MGHVNTAATDRANNNSFCVAEGEKWVQCWHCKGSRLCGAKRVYFCKCYYRVMTSTLVLSTAMVFVYLKAILLSVYRFRIVMSSG